MIVVLTICAINFSYFTLGTSCMDGFAIPIIGQPLFSADVLIVFKIMGFLFGHMNKSHVYLFTFIVTLKFLLQS